MVLVLVLLPAIAILLGGHPLAGTDTSQNIWITIGLTLLKVTGFIAFMLIIGKRLIPKIMQLVARLGSRELFTLTVVAAAVSIAYGSYAIFGVSMALGAFFAGMVVKESDFSHRAEEETLSLREIFAILFFVSVGMLFDPKILIEQPLHILAVVAIIMIESPTYQFWKRCLIADNLRNIKKRKRQLASPEHIVERFGAGNLLRLKQVLQPGMADTGIQ
jgi:CPA2 family monovalent cation:H+ antiporter-2